MVFIQCFMGYIRLLKATAIQASFMLEIYSFQRVTNLIRESCPFVTAAFPGLEQAKPGMAAMSGSDGHAFGLLLALHAGDGAPRGASNLGDDRFLLVFRQILHQKFVGPF